MLERGCTRRRSLSTRVPGGLLALLALVCWMPACATGNSGAPTQTTAAATSTETPSGDPLLIDGEPVLQVLIPDVEQGPLYQVTRSGLFMLAGGRWTKTPTRIDGRLFLADPVVPERLFRGNHPACTDGTPGPAVEFEVSDDGGVTWTTKNAGQNVRPLLVDPGLPETVYGSDCDLTLSSDAGSTWTRMDLFSDYDVVDLAVDGTRLYALAVSAEDQGRVAVVDLRDPLAPVAGETLLDAAGLRAIDAADGRLVAAGVTGVFITDDGGATWTHTRSGLETVTRAEVGPVMRSPVAGAGDSIGVNCVALYPGDTSRVLAGTSAGVFISQDDGATWVRYDEVPTDEPVIDLRFGLGGADLYATTPSGVRVVPAP